MGKIANESTKAVANTLQKTKELQKRSYVQSILEILRIAIWCDAGPNKEREGMDILRLGIKEDKKKATEGQRWAKETVFNRRPSLCELPISYLR